ncbi:hypothetical protein KVR01_012024 [Diaporthe batatas]|uniref:uncharacterized protein n=1 Tax=Diaporthe batatas TaxID=748121 RepID=UPI001D03C12F|nr:uncharacterized protein KVR01_012024 [Diaporthe batatas]KAG8158263.1 hypothetical protein KVR01_012024 [Diaporthe batatas]
MQVLVGETLCQDQSVLGATMRYADAVVMGTAIINCLPPSLRPWIAPLLALAAKYNQSRCLKLLMPVIEERIRVWEKSKSGVAPKVPDDFLQWMIERCAKAGPEQMEPSRIGLRLLGLVTMSVMRMVWVLSHCIQDLYKSPSKNDPEFLASLQEELMKMTEHPESSKATDELGSKDTIDSLHLLESTLRESIRLSAI